MKILILMSIINSFVFCQSIPFTKIMQSTPDMSTDSHFGRSFSLWGQNELLIAAPRWRDQGIVDVLNNENGTWQLKQRLYCHSINWQYISEFGSEIKHNDSTLIVSASGERDPNNAYLNGAVYYYKRINDSWYLSQKLWSPSGSSGHFGISIGLNNENLFISDNSYNQSEGIVYYYKKIDTSWVFIKTINNPDNNKSFGATIELKNNLLAISSIDMDKKGEVYFYKLQNDSLIYIDNVFGEIEGSLFGTTMSINNNSIAIGAPGYYDYSFKGAVYLYEYYNDSIKYVSKIEPGIDDKIYFGINLTNHSDSILIGSDGNIAIKTDPKGFFYKKENNSWTLKYVFDDSFNEMGKTCEMKNGKFYFGHPGDSLYTVTPRQRVGAVYEYSINPLNVKNDEPLINNFVLSQNFPNPFNPSTNIKFSLPEGGITTIKVYDILGEEKATMLNEYKPAGSYTATFDGKNFPSGVYIYTITSGSFKQSRKMLLMK
ncbi:MAG: T9SS type A sorting domain-containing protein [Syntrophothermus sp.]